MEFNDQEMYWGKGFPGIKGQGAEVVGGEPSDLGEGLTLVREEKEG